MPYSEKRLFPSKTMVSHRGRSTTDGYEHKWDAWRVGRWHFTITWWKGR